MKVGDVVKIKGKYIGEAYEGKTGKIVASVNDHGEQQYIIQFINPCGWWWAEEEEMELIP